MELTWQIALVSVVIPAAITAGLPVVSRWLEGRRVRVLNDADIGARLRDELRADNEALRRRVDALEGENTGLKARVQRLEDENGGHTSRITRLEAALRERGHHDVLEEMG